MSAPLRRFDLDAGAGVLVEPVQDPFVDNVYPLESPKNSTNGQTSDKPLPPTPSLGTPDKVKTTKPMCGLIKRILPLQKLRQFRAHLAVKNARKRAAKVHREEEAMQLKNLKRQTKKERKKHQFNGVSWGFDLNAGTTSRPNSGVISNNNADAGFESVPLSAPKPIVTNPCYAHSKPMPPTPGQDDDILSAEHLETVKEPEIIDQRLRRGTTWGLSEGGPGVLGAVGRN